MVECTNNLTNNNIKKSLLSLAISHIKDNMKKGWLEDKYLIHNM